MATELEFSDEELAALLKIYNAPILGESPSSKTNFTKRLFEFNYIENGSDGLYVTAKGEKWLADNAARVTAQIKGEEWLKKQMSKGNWIKE